ncbi:hypothetical protein TrST_g11874 [Triparma strigata]|uniref:Uncharacterized protein n=1 Tax=Triparma strigata TaxID=1606541 RepID=A0A9W7BI48_9STRA|nr:hypothetical protein TrST_g11874 [Triparma strigata]
MPKRAAVDSDADHNKRTTLLSNNMQDEDQFQGPPIFSAALPPGTSKETTHSDGTTAHRLHSFFYTDEFRYHFSDYIPSDTHLTMKFVCKGWLLLIDKYINQGTASGSILYHVGQEICCEGSAILMVVDIPEGVEIIGIGAFEECFSLTTVTFPSTLTYLGPSAFAKCSSLENVDLIHTNLKEICLGAFSDCSELKSMTIPSSLQRANGYVFTNCFKLVPPHINVAWDDEPGPADIPPPPPPADTMHQVIAHLLSLQRSKSAAIRKDRCERLGLTYMGV